MRKSSLPEPLESEFEADVRRLRAKIIAEEEAEAKAAFYMRLRAHGIQDRSVLRALELVPRQTFAPARYLELAARDVALPIDCGQTLDEPRVIARMIEALAVEPGHRVLQIGAGSGYATAILSLLSREVVAFERYRRLADTAQARVNVLDMTIANATISWGDGLALSPDIGHFERILVHGLLPDLPKSLTSRLTPDGILVAARPSWTGQALTRIRHGGTGLVETPVGPSRLQAIVPGLAAAL